MACTRGHCDPLPFFRRRNKPGEHRCASTKQGELSLFSFFLSCLPPRPGPFIFPGFWPGGITLSEVERGIWAQSVRGSRFPSPSTLRRPCVAYRTLPWFCQTLVSLLRNAYPMGWVMHTHWILHLLSETNSL